MAVFLITKASTLISAYMLHKIHATLDPVDDIPSCHSFVFLDTKLTWFAFSSLSSTMSLLTASKSRHFSNNRYNMQLLHNVLSLGLSYYFPHQGSAFYPHQLEPVFAPYRHQVDQLGNPLSSMQQATEEISGSPTELDELTRQKQQCNGSENSIVI